jgi:uncharacterized repeat protein (TIGR03806 family)
LLGCALLLVACGDDSGDADGTPANGIPETLSAWGLFEDAPAQVPADGVLPFDVTAPLYSDGSAKLRFLHIPEGEQINYDATEAWQFPVGSVLIKTFSQPEDEREDDGPQRFLETRLLVRDAESWVPLTYVWNDAQDEAFRENIGDAIDVTFTDASGVEQERTHIVPNTNECRDCHGTMENLDTLGGRTRMLNMDHDTGDGAGAVNQIDQLAELGLLDEEPAVASERETLVDPFGDASVSDRARAYMDSNCGSCHRPDRGEASQSGFLLAYEHTDPETDDPSNWGVCKVPTSAAGANCGLSFDVVPGNPDRSILICRVESEVAKVMMPPLGRTLVDEPAAALLREWITELPAAGCE